MKLGMVLEGGGMRGMYTAGVLDYLMDREFYPDGLLGVSAGACHGCSYASHQRGRSYQINLEHCRDKRYMSWSSWLKTGEFFNADFAYHRIPDELVPYNYEKFERQRETMPFYVGVTNVETGKPEYLPVQEMHRDVAYVRASSSLPLAARIIGIDGKRYLDGGIADSIPVDGMRGLGFQRNIVVLTRPAGYQKKPNAMLPAIRMVYGMRYPKLVEAAAERHLQYNAELARIADLEAAGEVFVLRPSRRIDVSRLERNPKRLDAIYELGYDDARAAFDELQAFAERARAATDSTADARAAVADTQKTGTAAGETER